MILRLSFTSGWPGEEDEVNILPFSSLLTAEPYETLFNTGSILYRLCSMDARSSNRHHLSISTSCFGNSCSGMYSKGPNDQWSVINRRLTNILICQRALVNHLLHKGKYFSRLFSCPELLIFSAYRQCGCWFVALLVDSYQNGKFSPNLKNSETKMCFSTFWETLISGPPRLPPTVRTVDHSPNFHFIELTEEYVSWICCLETKVSFFREYWSFQNWLF